jgi:hypothetical protein
MRQVMYVRLFYIVVFELPVVRIAGPDFMTPTSYRLACICSCKLHQIGDTMADLVEFNEMEDTPTFVHVGVIECAVGRVRTASGWTNIDRSSERARTIFNDEAVGDGSDED